MPTYKGKITDMEILALIAYMKQLSGIEVSEVPIPEQLGKVKSATDTVEGAAGTIDSATGEMQNTNNSPQDNSQNNSDNESQNE